MADMFLAVLADTRWQRAGQRVKKFDALRRIGLAVTAAFLVLYMTKLAGWPIEWKVLVTLAASVLAVPIWYLIERTIWYFRLPSVELREEHERLLSMRQTETAEAGRDARIMALRGTISAPKATPEIRNNYLVVRIHNTDRQATFYAKAETTGRLHDRPRKTLVWHDRPSIEREISAHGYDCVRLAKRRDSTATLNEGTTTSSKDWRMQFSDTDGKIRDVALNGSSVTVFVSGNPPLLDECELTLSVDDNGNVTYRGELVTA